MRFLSCLDPKIVTKSAIKFEPFLVGIFMGGTLRIPNFKIHGEVHQVGLKDSGSQNFRTLAIGGGYSLDPNFIQQRWQRCVTDGKNLSLKPCYLFIKSHIR
jgi:hypothetical protein